MKEQILIISLILAIVICLVLLTTYIINKKKIRKLTEDIDFYNYSQTGDFVYLCGKSCLLGTIFLLADRCGQKSTSDNNSK